MTYLALLLIPIVLVVGAVLGTPERHAIGEKRLEAAQKTKTSLITTLRSKGSNVARHLAASALEIIYPALRQ